MKIKLLLPLTLIFTQFASAKEVTILHTNDLHAHVEPFITPYISKTRKVGGFANISSIVKEEKSKNKATFYFDAGDYFTGPSISTLTKGQAIIDILDTMQLDAASVGNHEFDHGWDNTLVQLSKAKFPILLGNVYYQDSDHLFWDKPYTIVEKDGIKIGVIGLHGVFAFNDTVAKQTRIGIEARDEIEHLKKYLAKLRPNVDITVALMHEGVPGRQSSESSNDVARALDKDIQVAKAVKGLGLDVLITGHAHQGTPKPLQAGDTLIVSTDSAGIDIGKLTLNFDEKNKTIKDYQFSLDTVFDDEHKNDPQTQAVIDKWNKKLAKITSQIIGKTPEDLTRSYGQSSPLGNLVADAMLATYPDAQFALTNSGGIRNDIQKGDISMGDVISALPFPNELTKVTLSGAQIRQLIQHAASLTNGVLQISHGLEFSYDSTKKLTDRVETLTLNGKPIDDKKDYIVATNNFLIDGGDGYASFLDGKSIEIKGGYYISNAVIDYMKQRPIDINQLNETRIKDISK